MHKTLRLNPEHFSVRQDKAACTLMTKGIENTFSNHDTSYCSNLGILNADNK